ITMEQLLLLRNDRCSAPWASLVADANADQDLHELFSCGPTYEPAHHFDRVDSDGGGTDGAGPSERAFRRAAGYLQAQVRDAKAFTDAGDCLMASAALGRALHALQDFYAHSNFVDGGLTAGE